MARIVRFHQTGGPEVLRIEEVPPSPPGESEVRIAVKAIGLNRAESLFRQGTYLETPTPPSRLGYEAAGTVEAVGAGVIGVKIGDRVSTLPTFSMGRYGVYGDSVVVPA
jgi:NADPH:quinone reductase-like Zn-dependent oxidoreductase